MHDVITIGSATLDVFLECSNLKQIESDNTKHIMLPHGAKIEVDSALFETGGGGTNCATTFARQGFNVAVIAKIGKDFPGEKVIQKLKDEHITTDYIVEDPHDTTDFSTIIWQPKIGNVLLVNRGKGRLEEHDVDWESVQSKWFHLSSVEGNLNILKHVSSITHSGRSKGAKISWNPGKRELEQKEELIEILPHIELLIMNRTEAAAFFDLDWDDREEILDNIQSLPAKMKVVTDGSRGSYFWDGKQWIHAGTFKVERHEATGAGDAYGSGFVAGLIKGYDHETCLKLAAANAASVVTAPSAKKGILTTKQSEEWIKKELKITAV